jgi:hypothetical protein
MKKEERVEIPQPGNPRPCKTDLTASAGGFSDLSGGRVAGSPFSQASGTIRFRQEKPIPDVYPVLDTDLARDNLENDIPAADLEDL